MSATATKAEVKERPIIFSGPMVKAILDGRKTQTRRVALCMTGTDFATHHKADEWVISSTILNIAVGLPKKAVTPRTGNVVRCPYGKIGDRLWVRETWADADCMYQSHKNDVPGTIAYFADKSAIQYDSKVPRRVGAVDLASWNWNSLKRRPSIFMPRFASRITLEITNIRVERLQEISGRDVLAEGIDNGASNPAMGVRWENMQRMAFEEEWDRLNAKRGHSWASNPWVWCISFRRI